jgi:hypothetical protein
MEIITDKEKQLSHILIKNIINEDFNNIIDILNLPIETKIAFITNILNLFNQLNIINNNQDYNILLKIMNDYLLHEEYNEYYTFDIYICIDYHCLKFNNDNYFIILNLLYNIYNKKNFNDIIIKICKNSFHHYYSNNDTSTPTRTIKHIDEISIINFYELFNYNEIQKYLLEHN